MLSPYFDEQILAACAAKGLQPRIQHELPSTDLCLSYVAAGLGVTLVGDMTDVGENIRTIEFEDLDFVVTTCFLWQKERANDALIELVASLEKRYRRPAHPPRPQPNRQAVLQRNA